MPIVTTSRRAPGEQPPRKTVLPILEGHTRAHYLLEEGLEKGRHRTVPQREDHDEVLRRHNGISGLDQGLG